VPGAGIYGAGIPTPNDAPYGVPGGRNGVDGWCKYGLFMGPPPDETTTTTAGCLYA